MFGCKIEFLGGISCFFELGVWEMVECEESFDLGLKIEDFI